jgi:tetratricopeptide (TPR) repeat protein
MKNHPLLVRLTLGLLILGWLAVLLFLGEPHPGWTALALAGTVVLGAWLGWGIRQVWIYPSLLRRAQALWASHGAASEVAELLERASLASGELGRQIYLLLGYAHFTLGYTNQAWTDFLRADLARLPLWLQWPARLVFQTPSGKPTPRRMAWIGRLVRLAPTLPRLRHLQGLLLLRTGATTEAWCQFEAALPLAWDDPLVLEDLMLASLQNDRPDLAEAAMNLLRTRHGDARLPWDRGAASLFLLRTGRPAEALALIQGLPFESHTPANLWLAKSVALRRLGNPEGAWQVIQAAVAFHPTSFQLWMERHQSALGLHREKEALESLEQGWQVLPAGTERADLRQDWHLRRAEFAFWWEDQPEVALDHLHQVPVEARGDLHPPLELQIRLALGQHEPVFREVSALLETQAQDPDLRLLQADCMAGMGAWDALLPLLEDMDASCRQRPLFWHLRGLVHANLGNPHQAWLDLERALRMDPQNPRLLLDAGHGCAELGNWAHAENLWREVLLLAPQDEEALISLAEARRESHDPESARRYLRECLLHHPHSQQAQTALAELEAN